VAADFLCFDDPPGGLKVYSKEFPIIETSDNHSTTFYDIKSFIKEGGLYTV
jgi:hypothetical protein